MASDSNNTLHRDYTRFVILSPGRAGSNMLASALNEHPQLVCFGEVMNRHVPAIDFHVDGYDGSDSDALELRHRDPATFVEQRIFGEQPAGVAATGFKMMYQHFVPYPQMLDWFAAQRELRVIHLRRANLLRALVSLRVAEQTGGWVVERKYTLRRALRPVYLLKAIRHPLKAATALRRLAPSVARPTAPKWQEKAQPVYLSADECRFYFTWERQTASQYEEALSGHRLLALMYEDLVAERRRTLSEVQSFLGVAPRRLIPITERQNPEPLRELLGNFDELRTAFQDTEYASFFD